MHGSVEVPLSTYLLYCCLLWRVH